MITAEVNPKAYTDNGVFETIERLENCSARAAIMAGIDNRNEKLKAVA